MEFGLAYQGELKPLLSFFFFFTRLQASYLHPLYSWTLCLGVNAVYHPSLTEVVLFIS